MSVVAGPKRGLYCGVCYEAHSLLSIGLGLLIVYGQALFVLIIYYHLFLDYTFNIGGPIFEAWFGWPIIRTAPQL